MADIKELIQYVKEARKRAETGEQYVVYCATNIITGRSYVGQSCQFDNRYRDHIHKAFHATTKQPFAASINSHGEENFSWELLEEYDNQDDCNDGEEFFIAYLGTLFPNGYNMEPGGKAKKMQQITKDKIREKLKVVGSFVGKKGADHPNFGRKHSVEWKEQRSLKFSGANGAGAKLTDEKVLEIYNTGLNGLSCGKAAKYFQMCKSQIWNIYSKKQWKELLKDLPDIVRHKSLVGSEQPNSILNETQVIEILQLINKLSGTMMSKAKKIAKIHSVSWQAISSIIAGRSWSHIDRSTFNITQPYEAKYARALAILIENKGLSGSLRERSEHLSSKFGISRITIEGILRNTVWKCIDRSKI